MGIRLLSGGKSSLAASLAGSNLLGVPPGSWNFVSSAHINQPNEPVPRLSIIGARGGNILTKTLALIPPELT